MCTPFSCVHPDGFVMMEIFFRSPLVPLAVLQAQLVHVAHVVCLVHVACIAHVVCVALLMLQTWSR